MNLVLNTEMCEWQEKSCIVEENEITQRTLHVLTSICRNMLP